MKFTSEIYIAWTTFLGSTTTDHVITSCDVGLKQRIIFFFSTAHNVLQMFHTTFNMNQNGFNNQNLQVNMMMISYSQLTVWIQL